MYWAPAGHLDVNVSWGVCLYMHDGNSKDLMAKYDCNVYSMKVISLFYAHIYLNTYILTLNNNFDSVIYICFWGAEIFPSDENKLTQ